MKRHAQMIGDCNIPGYCPSPVINRIKSRGFYRRDAASKRAKQEANRKLARSVRAKTVHNFEPTRKISTLAVVLGMAASFFRRRG